MKEKDPDEDRNQTGGESSWPVGVSTRLSVVPTLPVWNQGLFSDEGDSGSIVFDVQGRVVGMLDGGVGDKRSDVTYVTPIEWILDDIRKYFDIEEEWSVLSSEELWDKVI